MKALDRWLGVTFWPLAGIAAGVIRITAIDHAVAHAINRTLIEDSGWDLFDSWRDGAWH